MARNYYTGQPEYATGSFTEANGKDMTAATVTVGLSTTSTVPPVTWKTPDATSRPSTSQIVASYLITGVAAGDYYLWLKVVDGPETLVRPCANDGLHVS